MRHTTKSNLYPVQYKDFLRIIETGNYVIMYAIFDDRIHFEMAIENQVFCTQKFHETMIEELKMMGEAYNGDVWNYWIRRTVGGRVAYRFYPQPEEMTALKDIKLYSELVVKKQFAPSQDTNLPERHDKLVETDSAMRLFHGTDLILEMEKVK